MLKNENVAQQMKDLLEKIQSNLFDRYASFKKCHDIQLFGRKLEWQPSPDMTITVDWNSKHQNKPRNTIYCLHSKLEQKMLHGSASDLE